MKDKIKAFMKKYWIFVLLVSVVFITFGCMLVFMIGSISNPVSTPEVVYITLIPTSALSPTDIPKPKNTSQPTLTPKPTSTSVPTYTSIPSNTATATLLKSTQIESKPLAPTAQKVVKPTNTLGYPPDITAICKDGTYSYSKHASGTCSGHGGVKKWINKP